jgi:hypothetical protein
MNEAAARQVLLLRAIETAAGDEPRSMAQTTAPSTAPSTAHSPAQSPAHSPAQSTLPSTMPSTQESAPHRPPPWTPQDAAWASRAALETAGPPAPAEAFVAERARHALQRLASRDAGLSTWQRQRPSRWRWPWWAGAMVVGGLCGLLADTIGGGQRINLLAPPVWGVVVWNLVVYALLLVSAMRSVVSPVSREPGLLTRALQRLQQRRWVARGARSAAAAAERGTGVLGPIGGAFALTWVRASAPLSAARLGLLLHSAAAALGLGLAGGMYLRGLVLDYRAGWESTFLDAAQVHTALSWLLMPALGASGTALPDVPALQALRFVPGEGAVGGPAAPWIHWIALTLLLMVVLPRALLALWSGWRAHRLSTHFPLKLDGVYFERLVRHQLGDAARVQVLPYAQAPSPAGQHGLAAVFGRLYGEAMHLHVSPELAFGAEDDLGGRTLLPPGTTLAVALFDLTATPEAEHQGRFVEALAQQTARLADEGRHCALLVLVDEAGFVRRFGALSERLTQRREAWRQWAARLGTAPVFTNLTAPDLAAAELALQSTVGAVLQAEAAG